jgi:ribosomal protein S6--L-glutamate ligase
MRITVLSRSASIASTRRLIEAGRQRGHKVRVLNPLRVEMHLDRQTADLYYQRAKLSPCDVVIPRIAQSITQYGLAVVNQFAMRGVPLMNDTQAIAQARNQMRLLQVLATNGIDIPATVMAREAKGLRELVGLVGGVPVLVKLLQGAERHGVMICETLQSLEATLEAVLGLGQNLVVQQYVKRKGHDLRIFVVGGQALAAVRRRARVGRMSKTLLRGARLERFEPNEAQIRAAVQTCGILGLEVAAVDLLDVKGGPKVFEVNSSPAIAEMEDAAEVDLATPIIVRAEALTREHDRPRAAPTLKAGLPAGVEGSIGSPVRGARR